MNFTTSPLVTVPYLTNILFTDQPAPARLNRSFEPKCSFSLQPVGFTLKKYAISFKKDGYQVGVWTVIEDTSTTFSTPSKLSELTVRPGSPKPLVPRFTVIMNATNTKANGHYNCMLAYNSSKGLMNFTSNEWIATFKNGHNGLVPSSMIVLAIISLISLKYFQ